MNSAPVVMYLKPWCPYCASARALLQSKQVDVQEIDIEAEPARRDEMIERSGGRWTVPQIFVGEHYVGGSDDLHALEAAGKLDPLLAGQ